MARLILLDSGPLGLIVRAPSKPQLGRCLAWLNTVMTNVAIIVIPDIAHYEVRRELIRIRAFGSLRSINIRSTLRLPPSPIGTIRSPGVKFLTSSPRSIWS